MDAVDDFGYVLLLVQISELKDEALCCIQKTWTGRDEKLTSGNPTERT